MKEDPKPNKGCLALAGLFLLVWILYTVFSPQKASDNSTTEPARSESFNESKAVIKADRAIKNVIRDPDSYERISDQTKAVNENGVYMATLITYRANNGFGGKTVERMLVTFDKDMNPITVTPANE